MSESVTSPVYVVRDNIDTDQIIPAQYLNLVPTIAEEYEKLGSYALIGLPEDVSRALSSQAGATDDASTPSSSPGGISAAAARASTRRSPWARAACEVVLAESFARIFFRNCVATGELYPCETPERLCDIVKTGDVATLDFDDGPTDRGRPD